LNHRADDRGEQLRRSLTGEEWNPVLAVLAGGMVGSLARTVVSRAVPLAAGAFPVATLSVNLVGSFCLGVVLARRAGQLSIHFWAIGVFGSFTTFSAFSFEVFELLDIGAVAVAAGYVAASLLGGLCAAVVGLRVGRP
jgi:fluoride exporter